MEVADRVVKKIEDMYDFTREEQLTPFAGNQRRLLNLDDEQLIGTAGRG
jgi:hypothetical protein